jgi:bifunctional non-homologous end joining protein LigD
MPISNPDKLLFPAVGVRKKALASYYRLIAPYMLPHVTGRPLSFVRFPDGADGEKFYQKEANSAFDEAFTRIDVEIDGGPRTYLSADTQKAVAAFGALVTEPHTWISRAPDFTTADLIVWDIDPPDSLDFSHVRTGARLIKTFLESLGSKPFAKVTGSRGIHVAITLSEPKPVSEVFELSRRIAEHLATALPSVFTVEFAKNRRGDRLYVDYLRNRYAQSFAAPFAVRALPTAPVAVPFTWDVLDDIPDAGYVTIPDVPQWLQTNRSWLMEWGTDRSDFELLADVIRERSG